MNHELINPEILGAPRGYSNGVLARPGRLLFVAGQIATSAGGGGLPEDFVGQFGQALDNVLAVVRSAGGTAEAVCRLTIYVTSKTQYLGNLKAIGRVYRDRMGAHYPAMALVQVVALVEDSAMVEIEATAVISEDSSND